MSTSSPDTFRRYVEVGRIVLITAGPLEGKIATIVEIIDQNRALVEGPTTGVPRQAITYKRLVLTPLVLKKLPRGARTGTVRKAFTDSQVVDKWNASTWAKKRAATLARRNTTDFDRFQISLLKRERTRFVRHAAAKALKA